MIPQGRMVQRTSGDGDKDEDDGDNKGVGTPKR